MTDERSKTDVSSDEVIRKYFDMVYKLALSQTKNQTFAEDVTQDVFVRFIQNKDKCVGGTYKGLAHSGDNKLLKECFYVIVVQENRSA